MPRVALLTLAAVLASAGCATLRAPEPRPADKVVEEPVETLPEKPVEGPAEKPTEVHATKGYDCGMVKGIDPGFLSFMPIIKPDPNVISTMTIINPNPASGTPGLSVQDAPIVTLPSKVLTVPGCR